MLSWLEFFLASSPSEISQLPLKSFHRMTAAEFRTDTWTDRQVIIAADRAHRPQATRVSISPSDQVSEDAIEAEWDPFLEGREDNTPSERVALRREGTQTDGKGWLLRIVANRYPAVASMTNSSENAAAGIHDVVIECPDFRRSWLQFSVTEVGRVLTAWQLRQQQLMAEPAIRTIQIFRNQGAAAGASLGHSHSQIVALTTVPKLVARRLENADGFDRWRASEIANGARIISAQDLLVVCPDASWVAGQIRICPLTMESRFAVPFHKLCKQAIETLAVVLRNCVQVVKSTFPTAGLNVVLNQPPLKSINAFPWSLDIMPRTASFAGFELACDIPIITTSPESASTSYRAIWAEVSAKAAKQAASQTEVCPLGYSWEMS